MKVIVYLEDGAIEATANHEAIVQSGEARYASDAESRSYEQHFERCDAAMREPCGSSPGYSHACGYHD